MWVTVLLFLLAVLTLAFLGMLGTTFWERPAIPSFEALGLSGIANFFDALGVGSFAPTTAYLKLRGLVSDPLIPSTMIVGYATAVVTEAFVYITWINVDPTLLCSCIVASCIGAMVGVFVTPNLPLTLIRTTMGVGLITAATMYTLSNFGLMPKGGTATSLQTSSFIAAVLICGILGMLINLGIGNFAPTLITFSLLGFDPRAAFPIMMGSAAFLMVTSGVRIVRERPLNMSIVVGLAIGGVPGVLVAAYLVKTLRLEILRWCVVAIVAYAGVVMLVGANQHYLPVGSAGKNSAQSDDQRTGTRTGK